MSYFVTCTHEQRILNGTSSDTSLCHWGYLEKKIFPDVPDLPDVARSGQIWPDLGRLGKFFFSKKKKKFPDLARSGRPRSGDLARSGSIRAGRVVCAFMCGLFVDFYLFSFLLFLDKVN